MLLDQMKTASLPNQRVAEVEYQVPYVYKIGDKKMFTYYLDFKVLYADGRVEHVDVKGVRTAVYLIKKKIVEAAFGIRIIEK